MFRQKTFSFAVVALSSFAFGSLSHARQNLDMPKLQPIRSIDVSDTDWSDLEPLGRAVFSRRIVLLGEASHGDGASFAAKTRIIRYLHDVHGFDVLAFESGMFEMSVAELAIQSGAAPSAVIKDAVFPLWANAIQFRPLIDWLDQNRQHGSRPVAVAGVDFQLTGALADQLPEVLYNAGDRAGAPAPFRALADAAALIRQKRMSAASSLDPLDLAASRAAALTALDRAKLTDGPWLKQLVDSIGNFLIFAQGIANPNDALLNRRDTQMASNLRYLADGPYRGRKIIVWGATSHFLRQRRDFANDGAAGMVPFGAHLSRVYGKDVYVLAVTSGGGKIGSWLKRETMLLPEVPLGSLEAGFVASGRPYGFARIPENWKGTSVMLGHAPMTGPWGRSVDGVVFIGRQTPATYPPAAVR